MRDARLSPFRGAALAFALFLLLQAGSGAVLFATKLGASPDRVAEFYRGAEERFVPPKTLDGLLLVAIPHLVAIPLVLFAAIHVIAWARALSPRAARAATAISFAAALLGVAAGFGTRFVAAELAWLKLVAFAVLEVALVGWAALLAVLFLPRRAGVASEARSPEGARRAV